MSADISNVLRSAAAVSGGEVVEDVGDVTGEDLCVVCREAKATFCGRILKSVIL